MNPAMPASRNAHQPRRPASCRRGQALEERVRERAVGTVGLREDPRRRALEDGHRLARSAGSPARTGSRSRRVRGHRRAGRAGRASYQRAECHQAPSKSSSPGNAGRCGTRSCPHAVASTCAWSSSPPSSDSRQRSRSGSNRAAVTLVLRRSCARRPRSSATFLEVAEDLGLRGVAPRPVRSAGRRSRSTGAMGCRTRRPGRCWPATSPRRPRRPRGWRARCARCHAAARPGPGLRSPPPRSLRRPSPPWAGGYPRWEGSCD